MKESKITLGMIGLGYWGPNLLRNFDQLPDCRMKVCCDLDAISLARAKLQYPYLVVTDNYDSVLNDSEIDAIVIATPAKTHYPLAQKALQRGKHLFIEKPITLSVQHALELVQRSEEIDRVLMVGHLMEYHPAIDKLKMLIQSGELGQIYYLYSQRVNLGRIRSNENALWSLAPHDFSVAMYLLNAVPTNVTVRGAAYLQQGIDDVVFVNLQFPSGVIAHIQLSWLDPHKLRRTTIVGSEKMVVFDDMETTELVKIYDKGVASNTNHASYGENLNLRFGDVTVPYIEMVEPLKLECQHFLDCVMNNRRPRSDGRDGLRVVQVLQAAQESRNRNGEPVKIQA
jgi:predicted dehydrogenase